MKKIIIFIFCAICSISCFAQSYTSQQRMLISDISSYLTKQGYSNENIDKGLKFKSENGTYYVEVSKEDKSPMYVRLCRYIPYSYSVKKEAVKRNIQELNAKFGAKTLMKETEVIIISDMFVTNSSEFTYAFPTMLKELQSVHKILMQ